MGSLPDSNYIVQTDGYWFVEAHDVDPSKGYITVSAKGIANGLSNQPNDDCDFGPDTYNPNYSGSGIPYTQTSGIQEALNYVNDSSSNEPLSGVALLPGSYYPTVDITMPTSPQATRINVFGMGMRNNAVIYFNYANAKGFVYNGLGTVYKLAHISIWSIPKSGTITIDSLIWVNDCSGKNFALWLDDVSVYANSSVTLSYNGLLYMNDVNQLNIYNSSIDGNSFTGALVTGTNYGANITYAEIINTIFTGNAYLNSCGMITFDGTNGLANIYQFGNTNRFSILNSHLYGSVIMSIYSDTGDIVLTNNTIKITENNITGTENFINVAKGPFTTGAINITDLTVVNDSNSTATFYIVPYSASANPTDYTVAPTNVIFERVRSIAGTGSAIPIVVPLTASSIGTVPYLVANPPVSGTVYQNTNPYDIIIYVPAYATTSGTAGSVAVAIGSSSTPSTTFTQFISGSTSSSSPDTIQIKVPAGWYYKVTTTGVTLATATVVAD